nr:immunoglobulin heavy chain junction region [Mus musculus]MBK4195863.1 immunoglobulin heavy chain junction region [Mus musculus]MBK4195864.1 immunoglobulin heavy chain junction region [Mus musculus]
CARGGYDYGTYWYFDVW